MNEQEPLLDDWDEVRVAYHVARLGTLSAAAAFLGVHHATVIRRIDALEARLGAKLFQRNPRGYNPTEAGRDLMQVAARTEEALQHLAGSLRGRSEAISGDLVVTALEGFSPVVTPMLVEFGRMHPEVRLTLVEDTRLLKLEHGEAHVALRAGGKPQEPDNIAQKAAVMPVTLFAHKSYVENHGVLLNDEDARNHRFVSILETQGRPPFGRWLQQNVPDDRIVFRASSIRGYEDAVLSGAGAGFLTHGAARRNPDLVQMTAPRSEWDSILWLVTHVDLHRAAKVQALATFLKDGIRERFRGCVADRADV